MTTTTKRVYNIIYILAAGAEFREPAREQVPQGEKVHPRGGSRSQNDAEGPSAQDRTNRAAEGTASAVGTTTVRYCCTPQQYRPAAP